MSGVSKKITKITNEPTRSSLRLKKVPPMDEPLPSYHVGDIVMVKDKTWGWLPATVSKVRSISHYSRVWWRRGTSAHGFGRQCDPVQRAVECPALHEPAQREAGVPPLFLSFSFIFHSDLFFFRYSETTEEFMKPYDEAEASVWAN